MQGRTPGIGSFVSFNKSINAAELIREDLEVAGLELTDREGNEIFFHSLRNSYISFLANSQTPPEDCAETCPTFRPPIDFQHLRKNL